jgi:hypothetical protein
MVLTGRPQLLDDEITLAMNFAGAETILRAQSDPEFLAKPNYPGALAARVYGAMREVRLRETEAR